MSWVAIDTTKFDSSTDSIGDSRAELLKMSENDNTIDLSGITNGQGLVYNSTTGKLEAGTVSGAGSVSTFATITVAGQSDVVADSTNDTLTLVAGTNVTLTTNASTDTVTINSTGAGSSSTFTITDGTTSQTIVDGDTLTLNGTANEINVAVSATDQMWIGLPDNVTVTDTLTASGLTINASSTISAGNNRITNTADPTASQDSATKAYVDSSVSGASNVFSTIAVSGQSDVVADSSTDTLTLVAGSNVTLTTNAITDTVTIASSGSGGGASELDDLTDCMTGPGLMNNVGILTQVNSASVSGNDNIGVGDLALASMTSGDANVGVGLQAGRYVTTGDDNIAIGAYALLQTNTGSDNIAIGRYVLHANTSSGSNTAIGQACCTSATFSGNSVTAIGAWSLNANTSGVLNSAIGYGALQYNTTGSRNTGLGHSALKFTQAGGGQTVYDYATGVGYDTRVSGTNQVQLGDSNASTYAYGAVQNRSDLRDKADVKDTALGLDFINALRPVDFKWDYRESYDVLDDETGELTKLPKDGSKKRSRYHHGIIAQELEEVLSNLDIDFGGFQDHSLNGGDDVKSVGYEELIAPMIKAIQELTQQVNELRGIT